MSLPALLRRRTNFVSNPNMVGAVPGTPGTPPTNWTVVVPSGVTSSIIGTGTESGIPYCDFQFTGTPGATGNQLRINVEVGPAHRVPTAAGQKWATSVYNRLIAGDFTNITASTPTLETAFFDASNVFLGNSNPTITTITAAGLATQRFINSGITTVANTAWLGTDYVFGYTSGLAINFTLRVGGAQMENAPTASALLLPGPGVIGAATVWA